VSLKPLAAGLHPRSAKERHLKHRLATFAQPDDAMVRKAIAKNEQQVLTVYLHIRSGYGGADHGCVSGACSRHSPFTQTGRVTLRQHPGGPGLKAVTVV